MDENPIFPNPLLVENEELIALGGDFNVCRLVAAYSSGIFPWFIEQDLIHWFSPETRLIIPIGEVKVSKSLSKVIRNSGMEVRFNGDFEAVIRACSEIKRKGCDDKSWISEAFILGYCELFKAGHAMCVETYMDGELVGGLYGVIVGKTYCGESMFAKYPNASKVALVALDKHLITEGFEMIDCQISSEHLI